MENPEVSRSMISPREIYNYDINKNIPWNISEYELPALHFDQKEIVRQRQFAAQKKGVKANDYYITKRGFYMDYDIKIATSIPGPDKHQKNQPWSQNKKQLSDQQLKTARSSMKFSYIDRIQMQEENRSKPAVGQYNLNKSMQDLKVQNDKLKAKKIEYGEKRYFYQNTEFLSDVTPGMGMYNPHLSVDKIHANKTSFKFWIDKHAKNDKLKTSRDLTKPNPASYSPTNQSFNTFQRTFSLSKKSKQLKNGFGSDSRFPYTRPNKKIILEERPAPWKYETKIDWKGKGNISPNKKRWNDILCSGSPPKVYS